MCVQRSDPVLKGLMNLRGGSNLDLLTTEEELDYELGAAGAGVLVVVDFMAEWCGPCKKLAPTLEALAERTAPTGKCKFFAVDVDQARELAAAKDVKSMPTILFYRDGKLVKRVVGADVAAIKAEVDKATMNPLMKLLKSETVRPNLLIGFQTYISKSAQSGRGCPHTSRGSLGGAGTERSTGNHLNILT